MAKNPAAVALGKLGGKKGAAVTNAKLTPDQRSASAPPRSPRTLDEGERRNEVSTAIAMRKLSPAQIEDLQHALNRGGRCVCARSSTQSILRDGGYIEQVPQVRDDASRQDIETQRDVFITDAKEFLASGNWRDARKALDYASARQGSLDHKVWGINIHVYIRLLYTNLSSGLTLYLIPSV